VLVLPANFEPAKYYSDFVTMIMTCLYTIARYYIRWYNVKQYFILINISINLT